MSERTAPVPRVCLSREDAAAALGMSVDSFERHVQPELRLIRRGKLRLVPVTELQRWAASRPATPAAADTARAGAPASRLTARKRSTPRPGSGSTGPSPRSLPPAGGDRTRTPRSAPAPSPADRGPTLREAADDWLTAARAGIVRTRSGERYKPGAIRHYQKSMRLRVYDALGHERLRDLTLPRMQRFVDKPAAPIPGRAS